LVVDSHSILARWRNYFSHLFNVHGVNGVRQTKTHTEEPLVPEPSAFEVELATEKLKSRKSPGIDQIPVELIKAEVEQFPMRSINLLFLSGIRSCLKSGRNRSLYLSTHIRREIKQNVVIIRAYQFVTYIQNFIQHDAVNVNSLCRGNYWGSSRWISTKNVKHLSHILHSSNT